MKTDIKELLKNLDLAIRAESAINAPNHAFIGPSVAQLALDRIQDLEDDAETKIKEIEIARLSLEPDEILVVTVRSDELTDYSMSQLRTGLEKYFPNNKILVLGTGESGSIDLTIARGASYSEKVSETKVEEPKVENCATMDYCSTCACGKKEAFERKNK